MNDVLFISDDSLSNPILHSQGLPLLKYLSAKGFACHCMSFEDERMHPGRKDGVRRIVEELSPFIHIQAVRFRPSLLWPGWLLIYVKGVLAAFKMVNDFDIKIIHARSFNPAMIALTMRFMFGQRLKVIYDYRGVFVDEQIYIGHWKSSGLRVKFSRYLESRALAGSDVIIAVSNALKRHLSRRLSLRAGDIDKRIFVIPNKTKLSAETIKSAKNEHTGGSAVTGVYSGSATRWQSVPDMVKLFKVASEYHPNISFKILTYDDRKSFADYFEDDKALLEKVQIINLNSKDVAEHLSAADFGILIREDHLVNRVASPLKFAEYLACGLPVLLSEGIGDTEETVEKHKVGVIIRKGSYKEALDQMIDLLRDGSLKERCMSAVTKEFNIEDAIREYHSIYNELLRDEIR